MEFKIVNKLWILFVVLFSVLFFKTVLFHWLVFHSVLISSIWHHTGLFFLFWLGKMIPATILASFIFIIRKGWWAIALNVIVDLWCISNYIYFQSNGLFLSVDSLSMIGNMDGFWSSILPYINWRLLLYPISTIIFAVCYKLLKSEERHAISFILTFATSLFLLIPQKLLYAERIDMERIQSGGEINHIDTVAYKNYFDSFFPFGIVYHWAHFNQACLERDFAQDYVHTESIISFLPATFIYHCMSSGLKVKMSEKDVTTMDNLLNSRRLHKIGGYNLIILLVESLESWAVSSQIDSFEYMPNLKGFANDSHVFFNERIKSQTLYGNSADGQMTLLTGLLPISKGAACFLYDDNCYPSFVKSFDKSVLVNPVPDIWNQTMMTERYGLEELIEPGIGEEWNDEDVISQMIQSIKLADSEFCIMGITITSHAPFKYGRLHKVYDVPGMPQVLSDYLNTLHYTDSCINVLLEYFKQSDKCNNTALLITGDHTIFRTEDQKMDTFSELHKLGLQSGRNYVPFILYLPTLKQNYHSDEEAFQSDIYSTIASQLGIGYWKGLGIDLLDTTHPNRTFTESESYRLSDQIIRSNYFKGIIDD